MKIQQQMLPFRPITIKLEKQEEAAAFYRLMEKIQGVFDADNLALSDAERFVLAQIIKSRANGVTI